MHVQHIHSHTHANTDAIVIFLNSELDDVLQGQRNLASALLFGY
jgi:hypothetical protein